MILNCDKDQKLNCMHFKNIAWESVMYKESVVLIMNIEYSNFMTVIHCYVLFRFAHGAFKLKYQI